MSKKKILFIIPIVIILLFIFKTFFFVNTTMYPKAKVVGNGSIEVACLGDSITYGLGVLNDRDNVWVSLLPKELGNNYKTINYGLSNRTLLSSGDMPYMKEKLVKKFWKSDPNIIIFMLGTNDTKGINWNKNKFREEYDQVINKILKEKSNSKLYIMIPPKIYITNTNKIYPNNKRLEDGVIPVIKDVNKKYKSTEIIDLYTLSLNHPEWFNDKLHPNKKGNKEIALEVARVIKETYKEK